MSDTYTIKRLFQDSTKVAETIKTGLTLEEAQRHCNDPETSSRTCRKRENTRRTQQFGKWFDAYVEE
jgi:hypothetical protein